jgi:hypothetical protein
MMLQLGIIVIIKPEGWRPDHTLYPLGFDRSLCHSLQSMFGVVNFHDSGFFHPPPVTSYSLPVTSVSPASPSPLFRASAAHKIP